MSPIRLTCSNVFRHQDKTGAAPGGSPSALRLTLMGQPVGPLQGAVQTKYLLHFSFRHVHECKLSLCLDKCPIKCVLRQGKEDRLKLSGHGGDGMPRPLFLLFFLLVEGEKGSDGNPADCGHQQQRDEQLTIDGVRQGNRLALRKQRQQVRAFSPVTAARQRDDRSWTKPL